VLGLTSTTFGAAEARQAPLDQGMLLTRDAGRSGWVEQLPGLPGLPPAPGGPGVGAPQGPGGGMPQASPEQQMEQEQQQYIMMLAKNLNMDPEVVKAALAQTQTDMQTMRITQIQQSVTDGTMTQEQATQLIQTLQSGAMGGPGGMPGFPGAGMPGR
jgi:hypothetical protein